MPLVLPVLLLVSLCLPSITGNDVNTNLADVHALGVSTNRPLHRNQTKTSRHDQLLSLLATRRREIIQKRFRGHIKNIVDLSSGNSSNSLPKPITSFPNASKIVNVHLNLSDLLLNTEDNVNPSTESNVVNVSSPRHPQKKKNEDTSQVSENKTKNMPIIRNILYRRKMSFLNRKLPLDLDEIAYDLTDVKGPEDLILDNEDSLQVEESSHDKLIYYDVKNNASKKTGNNFDDTSEEIKSMSMNNKSVHNTRKNFVNTTVIPNITNEAVNKTEIKQSKNNTRFMSSSLSSYFRPLDVPEEEMQPFLRFGEKLPNIKNTRNQSHYKPERTDENSATVKNEEEIDENMDVSILKPMIYENKIAKVNLPTQKVIVARDYFKNRMHIDAPKVDKKTYMHNYRNITRNRGFRNSTIFVQNKRSGVRHTINLKGNSSIANLKPETTTELIQNSSVTTVTPINVPSTEDIVKGLQNKPLNAKQTLKIVKNQTEVLENHTQTADLTTEHLQTNGNRNTTENYALHSNSSNITSELPKITTKTTLRTKESSVVTTQNTTERTTTQKTIETTSPIPRKTNESVTRKTNESVARKTTESAATVAHKTIESVAPTARKTTESVARKTTESTASVTRKTTESAPIVARKTTENTPLVARKIIENATTVAHKTTESATTAARKTTENTATIAHKTIENIAPRTRKTTESIARKTTESIASSTRKTIESTASIESIIPTTPKTNSSTELETKSTEKIESITTTTQKANISSTTEQTKEETNESKTTTANPTTTTGGFSTAVVTSVSIESSKSRANKTEEKKTNEQSTTTDINDYDATVISALNNFTSQGLLNNSQIYGNNSLRFPSNITRQNKIPFILRPTTTTTVASPSEFIINVPDVETTASEAETTTIVPTIKIASRFGAFINVSTTENVVTQPSSTTDTPTTKSARKMFNTSGLTKPERELELPLATLFSVTEFKKPEVSNTTKIFKPSGTETVISRKSDSDVSIENIHAAYILAALGFLPMMVIVIYVVRSIMKKKHKTIEDYETEMHDSEKKSIIIHPVARLPTLVLDSSNRWEFPRAKLRLQTLLGQGNFGQVWKAEADDLKGHIGLTRLVAVKTIKDGAGTKERDDLLKELAIMQKMGSHPNVVTLLGCCTDKEPYLLIMEYVMYGKLLTFLRDHRTRRDYYNFSDDAATLTARDLTVFAYCAARGMEYLASKGIIHRDLAARNILVDHNKLCKIADFGMSRDASASNGEVTEPRAPRNALPVRWMAVESLLYSVFTHKTDVWAFGVLLWEIVTLGSSPYANMSGREVMRLVCAGYRLERPGHCRPELYGVMARTWTADPASRPTFQELREDLAALLEQPHPDGSYVDLESFRADPTPYEIDNCTPRGNYFTVKSRFSEFECDI